MKFLGIDGGGTKTEFLIIDDKGSILGHTIKGTCHYKQTSIENFKNIMNKGITEVCNQVNISSGEIDYSFIGVPGYGEIQEDISTLESILGDILCSKNYQCGNDAIVAWAGSLGCQPGINIVAGTGAIAYGVDKNGKTIRSSGWGHFCGDEGSAFWLGKKVIETFTKEADGRVEKTPLYEIVKKELNITDDFQLLDIVTNKLRERREEIAKFAKMLHKAAKANDKIAIEIYSNAAYEHYITIRAILEKLDFSQNEEILISYSGGVFNAEEYVIKPFRENLKRDIENIKLIQPILKPVSGGALYAFKLYGGKVHNIIDNLKKEQNKLIRL